MLRVTFFMRHILSIDLFTQLDLSAARQRTRQIAAFCGFTVNEQTRFSTTVSELARGAVAARSPGRVAFALASTATHQELVVGITLRPADGAGADMPAATREVLAHARRFLDRVDIDGDAGRIVLLKALPAIAPELDAADVALAVGQMASSSRDIALSEAQQRNRELRVENDDVASLNDALQQQAESLLSADQRKDAFMAILAHELRGPLAAVAMAGEVLRKNPDDPERSARMGELVVRQSAHMSRMVEDLMDVSRIVRNEFSVQQLPVDLRDVVALAVEQLQAAAQRRAHHVAVEVPEGPVTVLGDRTRLIQVVGNLVGNAIRYTPEGGRIGVALLAGSAQASIVVTDNGIGMPAELVPRLFQFFVQAERSSPGRDSGLGLGLALVKSLVAAHGGRVQAHSDGPDRGSRFEIVLPLASAATAH